MKQIISTLAAAAALSFTAAHAAPVVVANGSLIPDAQVADFEAFDGLLTGGPELVAPGVTFTGDVDSTVGAFISTMSTPGRVTKAQS